MEVCCGTPFLLQTAESQGSRSKVFPAGSELQVQVQRADGVPDGVRDCGGHQPGQEPVGQSLLPVSLPPHPATNDAKFGETKKYTRISRTQFNRSEQYE